MNYYSRSNLAYDLTLFEEERNTYAKFGKKAKDESALADESTKMNDDDERFDDVESTRRVRRVRRRKSHFGWIALGVVFAIIVAFVVASIIHGQVQLTELNQEIANAKADLAEQQSIYTQLEMKVDSSVSTTKVEEYAQKNLHMVKATNPQKEFVKLSDGDKAEVSMSAEKNVFESIAEAFSSLWS